MRLYVAMEDGVEMRTQANETWAAHSRQLNNRLECVAASDAIPERVFCGTFGDGLLRSVNGGETFERIGESIITPDAVTCVAIDPHDPDVILAGTEPSEIYRSENGGDTWEKIGGITEVDSADTWSFPPRPETHHIRWISIAPRDSDRWYVGIEAGAFLLTPDGGETWIDRPPGSRRDNHSLATHSDDPRRVYAAAGDGYAESSDAGETWDHPQEGLDHRYVWSVTVDPGDSNRRFVSGARGAYAAHRAGRADAHVYRRIDDGPWEALTDLPVGKGVLRHVLGSGSQRGNVFAVSNHGIFETRDAGDRWDEITTDWPERYAEQAPQGIAIV